MKTKGKRQKQKPPLQPKTKCPTSEKFFTLFSSWKIQTTWVLPNPLLQPNQESGSAAISPLENYPSPCQHRPRPLDSRSPGCPWASHPDVIGSCLPVPSRAPGKFLQKSFHTHAQEIKEDAIDLPMPSLTLPVLTMALNEHLKLNDFIKVCLQS